MSDFITKNASKPVDAPESSESASASIPSRKPRLTPRDRPEQRQSVYVAVYRESSESVKPPSDVFHCLFNLHAEHVITTENDAREGHVIDWWRIPLAPTTRRQTALTVHDVSRELDRLDERRLLRHRAPFQGRFSGPYWGYGNVWIGRGETGEDAVGAARRKGYTRKRERVKQAAKQFDALCVAWIPWEEHEIVKRFPGAVPMPWPGAGKPPRGWPEWEAPSSWQHGDKAWDECVNRLPFFAQVFNFLDYHLTEAQLCGCELLNTLWLERATRLQRWVEKHIEKRKAK